MRRGGEGICQLTLHCIQCIHCTCPALQSLNPDPRKERPTFTDRGSVWWCVRECRWQARPEMATDKVGT